MHGLMEGSGSDGLEDEVGEGGQLVDQVVSIEYDPSHSRSACLQSSVR